jgi:dihydropteroate synthase
MVTTEQPAPPVPLQWAVTRGTLLLTRPLVMGIVNVTPDSFADGGQHASHGAALAHCERLVREGADVLDVGGESTRPGAQAPGTAAELARVMPVLQGALRLGVPVSVDTSDPVVMQHALDAGADIINDVRALTRPGALQLLAAHGRAGVCLMHMRGEPSTMQTLAHYGDVVQDVVLAVLQDLALRLQQVQAGGVASQRVLLDPGIGFAKTPGHNLALLQHQHELLALPRPLLLGWSRKGTLGQITGRGVADRLAASVAAAVLAVQRGASVVRVHDVAATVDALKVWHAVQAGQLDCWPTITWATPADQAPSASPL